MVVVLVPVAAPFATKIIIGGLGIIVSTFTIISLAFGFTTIPKPNKTKSNQVYYGIPSGTYSEWHRIPIKLNQLYYGSWNIRNPEYLSNIPEGRCSYNLGLKDVYCLKLTSVEFNLTKSQYRYHKLTCDDNDCVIPTTFIVEPSPNPNSYQYLDPQFLLTTLGFHTNFQSKPIQFKFTLIGPSKFIAWYQLLLVEVKGNLVLRNDSKVVEKPISEDGMEFNLSIPLVYQDNYVGFYGIERVRDFN